LDDDGGILERRLGLGCGWGNNNININNNNNFNRNSNIGGNRQQYWGWKPPIATTPVAGGIGAGPWRLQLEAQSATSRRCAISRPCDRRQVGGAGARRLAFANRQAGASNSLAVKAGNLASNRPATDG